MPKTADSRPEPMPVSHARHLLNPIRGLGLSPKKLVRRLALAPEATVLELGPGPGYFSPAVARAVPRGLLILVDVQPQMLEMAKARLEAAGIGNAEYRVGDATSLPLENATCDAAFLVAVLGEVPDRAACLQEIRRVLRPGGLVSVSEISLFDPDHIPLPEMLALTGAAGLTEVARHRGLFHYTLNVRRIP